MICNHHLQNHRRVHVSGKSGGFAIQPNNNILKQVFRNNSHTVNTNVQLLWTAARIIVVNIIQNYVKMHQS